MAYEVQYIISFTNEQHQTVEILLSQQDGDVVTPVDIEAVKVKLTFSGNEDKYAPIYGAALDIEIDQTEDDDDLATALETASENEWQVDVTIDGEPAFHGFILPDEFGVPFQDKPYNTRITAVDGIGLLKDKELVNLDGEEFDSHHSMIEIAAAILKQTGLSLPIIVYDNVYERSHTNRDSNINSDMCAQTYLEYRTFQKDATTFVSCYEALEILLKDTHRIFQWNGNWVIIRLSMLQYIPLAGYYTIYDANGANPAGHEITEPYALVGKNEIIYPCHEDQMRYVKKASKWAKSNFEYQIWPELPRNNKFERGTLIATGTATDGSDLDGDGDFTEVIGTYRSYTIEGWTHGQFNITDTPNFSMTEGVVNQARVNKIFNPYEVEIAREVELFPVAAPGSMVSGIKSEAIPVVQGDRIKFSVDKRFDADVHSAGDNNYSHAAIVYIIPTGGGDPWYLINNYTDPTKDGLWTQDYQFFSFFAVITIRFGDTDTRKYASVSVESQPIPVSGEMHVILMNRNVTYKNYYRNFELEYFPMVGGGFQKVKGESFKFTQTAQDWPDNSEDTVYISDNAHKVFKGCLLNSAGAPLSGDWYRLGVTENKRYLQLTNYNKFQLEQRRYWFIEGTFTGLMYNGYLNPMEHKPLGLHKQYRFTDIEGVDRRFILGAPLEMDLITGEFTGRFYEVYIDNHIFFDGVRAGTSEFKYKF